MVFPVGLVFRFLCLLGFLFRFLFFLLLRKFLGLLLGVGIGALSSLYSRICGFDVYGHLDYAVRYCPDKNFVYRFDDYRDIFEVLLNRLIENGKGIEINTSGIAKIGYPHPHIDALKLYKQLGGEIITVGSDAHKKENIGTGFDVAENILKELGFRYYTVFKERKPEFIPLF